MKLNVSYWLRNLQRLGVFVVLNACVDRLNFDVPAAQLLTTIEGMISSSPGPYTVKISQGVSLNADSVVRVPISGALVTLFDDEGHSESFVERNPGDYSTVGVMQGKIDHSYYIRVQMTDGRIFESEPDMIKPVGEIEKVKFEYEARVVEQRFGVVPADVFKVYVDSRSVGGDESYVRWRFTGTYKVFSYPERHYIWAGGFVLHDPYPCSGLAYVGPGTAPTQLFPCQCCTCWAHDYEDIPQLSDGQLVSNGEFKNIQVGTVKITNATFYEKYLIEVEQMSLTQKTFEFFKLIRTQKEGVSSLFQPPSGVIRGNMKGVNTSSPVIGMFWATSITKSSLFIRQSDVPYPITPIPEIRYPCTWYPYATTNKPANWE